MKRQALLSSLFLTAMLLACAINPNLSKFGHKVEIPMERQIARDHSLTNAPIRHEYHLGYGDAIEVKFFNHSEYNELIAVRPDGKITLQRIGDIDVVNIPVSQLDSLITRNYSEILVNPQVTVIVREFGGQLVYVMGEVQHPGSYEISKGMSLLRAITTAGGPLHSARMNSIILVRGNENNNVIAERIDLMPSNLRTLLKNDVQILPYDLVYVPKTFVADLESFVSRIYKIVVPPLDLAARFQYYSNFR